MTAPRRFPQLRRPVRREGAERYLFVTLVSFAATVIATRWLLSITGFPRIGGGDLHIARALWDVRQFDSIVVVLGHLVLLAAVVGYRDELSRETEGEFDRRMS